LEIGEAQQKGANSPSLLHTRDFLEKYLWVRHCAFDGVNSFNMGKKRKTSGAGSLHQPPGRDERTRYHINEEFADSEDEFFAERDQISFQDDISSKRRRVDDDGRLLRFFFPGIQLS
jgi:hypothetical protein